MNCPYCYNNSSFNGTFLNKEKILNIIDQCFRVKIREITISGGEPFLHPNIYEIIDYANSKNIKVRIITNLSLVRLEDGLKILKAGNYFQLTLDSTDKIQNDGLRGLGTFDRTVSFLEAANKEGISKQIVLRMNLSKLNLDKVVDFINLSLKFKIKHISVAFIANCGRGKNYEYAFSYNKDLNQMIEIMQKLKKFSSELKEKIDINYNNLEDQVSCPIFTKGSISLNPRIDPVGDVFFCGYFFGKENALGNVFDKELEEIINSSTFQKFCEKVRERKNNKRCDSCLYNKVCSCGCPAISYMNSDNILDIDTQCSMIKTFMKNRIKRNKGLIQ